MGIFDRLFGRTPNPESKSNAPAGSKRQDTGASVVLPRLYDPSHPAASDIAEAERLATSLIAQGRYGVGSVEMQDMFDVYARIKQPIDKAIECAPTDPDLLYARASLHYLCLQGEDGKRDREYCLALDPNHFDASQMGTHFASWKTAFHLPHWDVNEATLPDQVAERLSRGQNLQLVRDHLRIAVTREHGEGPNG